jgi:hypothetical protein
MNENIDLKLPISVGKPTEHPIERKYDVIRTLLATGNHRIASEMHGVALSTLRQWKKTQWWPELLDEVKREQREELQSRLGKIAAVTLDIMEDRLENGEFILNNKTGELIRKPVGLRDANQAMNNLMTQATKIEELNSKEYHADETVADVLKQLAGEFAKFNKKNTKNVVDVEFKEV